MHQTALNGYIDSTKRSPNLADMLNRVISIDPTLHRWITPLIRTINEMLSRDLLFHRSISSPLRGPVWKMHREVVERASFVDLIDSWNSDLLENVDGMAEFLLAGDALQARCKRGGVLDGHCSPYKIRKSEYLR